MAHEKETLEALFRLVTKHKAPPGLAKPWDAQPLPASPEQRECSGEPWPNLALSPKLPRPQGQPKHGQPTGRIKQTENKVAFSRQALNDLVTAFNTLQNFPIIFAGMFGHGQDGTCLNSKKTRKPQGSVLISSVDSAETMDLTNKTRQCKRSKWLVVLSLGVISPPSSLLPVIWPSQAGIFLANRRKNWIHWLASVGCFLSSGGSGSPHHRWPTICPNTNDPQQRRILNIVEEMAIASGTPVPPVYLMEEKDQYTAEETQSPPVVGIIRGCWEIKPWTTAGRSSWV